MFKQIGLDKGDFTICLGDRDALKKSKPYIDNSEVNKYVDEKYEDLLDPMIFQSHSLIIARMRKSDDLLILIFDMDFNNIIDGLRCKQIKDRSMDGTEEIYEFQYTHTFNSWVNKRSANGYYRKRLSFLLADKKHQMFIATRDDKFKDQDDFDLEERIRKWVTKKHEEMHVL